VNFALPRLFFFFSSRFSVGRRHVGAVGLCWWRRRAAEEGGPPEAPPEPGQGHAARVLLPLQAWPVRPLIDIFLLIINSKK
jgi:hypothetical protein